MIKAKPFLFNPRIFSFFLGLAVVFLVILIQSYFKNIDYSVLDFQFNLRSANERDEFQKGVSQQEFGPRISPDLLLVGVDNSSLSRLGRWPWPRYRHADFLNSLSRISDQNRRERAVMVDFFFFEPSNEAENDALFRDAIKDSGRLYLEATLDHGEFSGTLKEEADRNLDVLTSKFGTLQNVQGPWTEISPFKGVTAPLAAFGEVAKGFGHAAFMADADEKFRRQALVVRVSRKLKDIPLEELKVGMKASGEKFQRFGWNNKLGEDFSFLSIDNQDQLKNLSELIARESPPDMIDTNDDGEPDKEVHNVSLYQDAFIPSITLSLSLAYFNKKPGDIEVRLGEYIRIPSPEYFDVENGKWVPYRIKTADAEYDGDVEKKPASYRSVPEIRIPIDKEGSMLINFMGPRSSELSDGNKTFPLRSYSGYATRPTSPDPSTWVRSIALENKIVLAGAFSTGMADDEKSTPMGLMYGVEVHANALNTILMDNFLYSPPVWLKILILIAAAMLVAFYSSRLGTPWALVVTLVLIVIYFFGTTLVFENSSIVLDFSGVAFSMFFTLLVVIAYRVMTEEREKRRIQGMFGKYVSREMVDQMIASGEQPELGGLDKELTVLFSDIRGFTTLSESMSPQELVNHLNIYLTEMTNIIFEYKGTLDKYVGDEVMCFWGAPVPQADHALLACKCALRQMEKLKEMNDAWPPERRIDIGIGVNSGIMTVGNMGSPGRLNYTLMGDNVNLGARLEGTNKAYFTHVIISEYTYGLVKDKVIVRELDNIRVKGKNKPVVIYELVDVIEDQDPPVV